jgi:hypothetical protein
MEYMVSDGLFQPACIYSFKINHKDEQTALHEKKNTSQKDLLRLYWATLRYE